MTTTDTYAPLTREEFEIGSPGTWYGITIVDLDFDDVLAWGHVEPETMVAAVNCYDKMTGCYQPGGIELDQVRHTWAMVTRPRPEWEIELAGSADTPGAFAVTAVCR